MKAWADEHQRAQDALKAGVALKQAKPAVIGMQDYRDVCSILGDDFLDDDFLARELLKIKSRIMKGDFKMVFSPGTHCLAPIPFDEYGYYLAEGKISSKEYLKRLLVRPDGLTYNFAATPAYFFSLLPEEVRQHCSFNIPPYKNGLPLPDKSEVDFILSEYIRVFNNLRILFNKTKPGTA